MLARRLVRRGFELSFAVDGAQAVSFAREQMPDLVLMDLSLPVLDGWEATRQIKADPKTSIPIIALTAHAMEGDRRKATAAGADDGDAEACGAHASSGKNRERSQIAAERRGIAISDRDDFPERSWVPGSEMFRQISVALHRLNKRGIAIMHAVWQQGEIGRGQDEHRRLDNSLRRDGFCPSTSRNERVYFCCPEHSVAPARRTRQFAQLNTLSSIHRKIFFPVPIRMQWDQNTVGTTATTQQKACHWRRRDGFRRLRMCPRSFLCGIQSVFRKSRLTFPIRTRSNILILREFLSIGRFRPIDKRCRRLRISRRRARQCAGPSPADQCLILAYERRSKRHLKVGPTLRHRGSRSDDARSGGGRHSLFLSRAAGAFGQARRFRRRPARHARNDGHRLANAVRASGAANLKEIIAKRDLPSLDEPLRRLVDWIARWTLAPRGMVLRMGIRAPDAAGPEPIRLGIRLAGPPPARLTPARARVIAAAEGGMAQPKAATLAEIAGCSTSVIDGLVDKGHARSRRRTRR